MREELVKAEAPAADPSALARRDAQKPLPRRFYAAASTERNGEGFAILLDGRIAKTPARRDLIVPTLPLAEAIAAEWAARQEVVDFAAMPLTRLAFTAIDGVADRIGAVCDEIAKYAETDLVCYRAAEPASLVAAQAQAWDRVLEFAAAQLEARFFCVSGVVFAAQPEEAKAAVKARLAAIGGSPVAPFALASLSVITALTGSILIALALVTGALSLDAAWQAAHVDEDFQIRQWGEDSAAAARRHLRFTDMAAAERFWRLLSPEAR